MSSPRGDPAGPTERVVRVFVSSTFRDMQAERDELIKRVFPRLRKLCEERGVTWGEVDLRWGITDEQKAEGRVLPVCLEEIRRCRPYFIGLLGERYGWVPDEIDPEVAAREPWLAEHRGRSVTELEIVHGVLNDPEMAEHSFFYLRDPAHVDSLPKKRREDFREGPAPEEISEYGPGEAEERAEKRRGKLAALKARIRESGLPVRDYPDPQAAGELILQDLTAVINGLFPEGSEPDPLDRQAAEHEAFARTRAGVYIGRSAYFDRLDAHADGDGPPLAVLGESGSGKSALLANWARAYRVAHPDVPVIMHFVGSSPQSTDWTGMLRRVMGELARRFGIESEIPDRAEELPAAFANSLHMAAARGRVILVLDALNQLEDREGAPDLVWLPQEIPAELRLVVSTLPGRPLEELNRRRWPVLEVERLEAAERKELIRAYLTQYRKELSPPQSERIAAAEQCANPLFLRVLLEELRLWGEHETLDERIEHYLAAPTIPDLYRLVIERWEADYERERPGLVGEAMSLLWAARRGLSQAELLDLLGAGGEPLPAAHWSPFSLAAEQSLGNRAGLIGFAHDFLRQAVRKAYVSTEAEQKAAHVRLADYFDPRRDEPRGVDELPWQLAEAAAWRRLHDLLADPEFLDAAWMEREFDVKGHWARLESESDFRMERAYSPIVKRGTESPRVESIVATLLNQTGHPEQAFAIRERLVEREREAGDLKSLQASLGSQAVILAAWGRREEALALLQEKERICREIGYGLGLQRSLVSRGAILQAWGRLDEAMDVYQEAHQVSGRIGDKQGLKEAVRGQAAVLKDWGRLKDSMSLYQETERMSRELGDRAGLKAALGGQAVILRAWGRLKDSMAMYQETERMSRELGDRAGLKAALGGQAVILRTWGRLDDAMALYQENERISRELGDKPGLKAALGGQAVMLIDGGRLDEAMDLLKQTEQISRELGDRSGLKTVLGHQAVILRRWGRPEEAMDLRKQEELICRELGDRAGLQASLANQAVILIGEGRPDEAMRLLKEQEEICRELGDRGGLQASLGNQAVILADRGRPEEALGLLKEKEQICRELGDRASLAASLAKQAATCISLGWTQEAANLAAEAEEAARAVGSAALLEQLKPVLAFVRQNI